MKKDSIKKKKNLMIYEMQKEKQTELQMITGFETLMITAVFFFFYHLQKCSVLSTIHRMILCCGIVFFF